MPEGEDNVSFNEDRLLIDRHDSASVRAHSDFSDSVVMSMQPLPGSRDLVDFKIWLVHFVLGCTALVPCTLLVTVMPFFQSRVLGSPFAGTFSSYVLIAHNSSAFIFLAHATAISKSSLPTRQTRLTILAVLLLTFLTTLSALVRTTPSTFFTFIMLVAVLSAAGVSYFQSPVFAVASIFGPRAVQAVMAGQAAVGVVINLVQLVSAAISLRPGGGKSAQSGRAPEEISAFVCFAFTTCFLCVSLVAHSWLVRTPAYKILIVPIERRIVAADEREEHQALLSPLDMAWTVKPKQETARERIIRVAKANVIYEMAVAYVFVVTLSVFPPITIAIKPVNPGFHPLLFSAAHVLLFSLGDLFGRHLCSFPSLLIWSPYRLLGLSLAHTLFVPLFLACNIQLPSSSPTKHSLLCLLSSGPRSSPLINSDLLFFLILFAFGTSNGYVSTLCLMAAPSLEHNKELKNKEDVDTAVTIGLFCMVGGLTAGSFASFAIRAVVCRCNPFVG